MVMMRRGSHLDLQSALPQPTPGRKNLRRTSAPSGMLDAQYRSLVVYSALVFPSGDATDSISQVSLQLETLSK